MQSMCVCDPLEAKSKDFQCSLTLKESFELYWDESKRIKGQVPQNQYHSATTVHYKQRNVETPP